MKHLKLQFKIIPLEDAIVHTHWSDHLKRLTHTNCHNAYKLPKSCSLTQTLAEHTFTWWISLGWTEAPETSIWNKFRIALTVFHTCGSEHWEISMHTNSHSHPVRIQVDFTKKHLKFFFLSQITKSLQRFPELGQLKPRNCKSSEVSRDVLGYHKS